MKKYHILICVTLVLVSSCKTLSIQNKQYQTTKKKVMLSGVGVDETYELERTYSYSGIPNYKNPVNVQLTPISFTKATFNAYSQAVKLQPTKIDIKFNDSLPDKPKFMNIETADKIGLIHLLNDDSNEDVKNYLLNQNDSHVVTNISIVFNDHDMADLIKSDEVFVSQEGLKSVRLKLYTDGKPTRTINFNDGVVFAYRVSSCCWKENNKYQLEIVDLVEGDNACPNQTYSSAKRAKKKIDYYKF